MINNIILFLSRTIEVTTITEKTTTYQEDTDFFSSQRRRRSPENEFVNL